MGIFLSHGLLQRIIVQSFTPMGKTKSAIFFGICQFWAVTTRHHQQRISSRDPGITPGGKDRDVARRKIERTIKLPDTTPAGCKAFVGGVDIGEETSKGAGN